MGEKRVEGWVSLAVHGHVRRLAAASGLSVSEWVADLVVREVQGGGERGVGAGVAVPAEADGGGSGVAGGCGGGDPVGVVADVARVIPDWEALLARGRESRASTGRASGYSEAMASVALDRSGDGQTISLTADPLEEIA